VTPEEINEAASLVRDALAKAKFEECEVTTPASSDQPFAEVCALWPASDGYQSIALRVEPA